jgi:hypothetical protein
MTASRALVPILVIVALVALALLGLWLASRAPVDDATADVQPIPSPELRELVEAALDMARMVAISSGQDVLPASISENGMERRRTHAGYIDPGTIGNGSQKFTAADYKRAVELGLRTLAAQDDDRAILAYSGRVQHDDMKTDAIIVEAYARDNPVTFRFAQPYAIDAAKQTGGLNGPLFRLPDGPPHFTQPSASRQA